MEEFQYYLEDVDTNPNDDVHNYEVKGGMVQVDNFLLQSNETKQYDFNTSTSVVSQEKKLVENANAQSVSCNDAAILDIQKKINMINWLLILLAILILILTIK